MAWNQRGGGGRLVSKREAKICPLCGALNFHVNSECHLCGWHGQFEQDAAAIDYRWQRLEERYEEVRLEHLAGRGARLVGDFGEVRHATLWQRCLSVCAHRWQAFQAARDARCAERIALLRPKSALPPN